MLKKVAININIFNYFITEYFCKNIYVTYLARQMDYSCWNLAVREDVLVGWKISVPSVTERFQKRK